MRHFSNVIKMLMGGGILLILIGKSFAYTDVNIVLQVKDISLLSTSSISFSGYNCIYYDCPMGFTYEQLTPIPLGNQEGYKYAGSLEHSPIWEDCNEIAIRLSNHLNAQLGPTRFSTQTSTNDPPGFFYWIVDVKDGNGNHIQNSPFNFDDYYTFEYFVIGSLPAGKYSVEVSRCYGFPSCSVQHYKNAKAEFEVRNRSFVNTFDLTGIDNCDDANGIEVCIDFDEATGFTEKTVNWGDGNSEPVSTENMEVCHIYETEGIYTITVDYEYEYCEDQVAITKSVTKQFAVGAPLVSIASGATVVCSGVLNPLTLTAHVTPNTAGTTYAWSNSESTESVEVTPTENTAYHVTVTYPVSGCTATASINIEVDPDCCEPVNTSLLFSCNSVSRTINPTYGSIKMSQIFSDLCVFGNTLEFGVNPSQVTEIAINGVLIIDGNYTIVGGKFKMGAGAAIAVNSDIHVEFVSCDFYACDEMWQGMIANYPTCSLTFRHCKIEDAITGVALSNRAVINAFNSTLFHNNLIGVAVTDFSGNTSPYNGVIRDCTFSRDYMKTPHTGEQTSCGIIVSGVKNWRIPSSDDNPNLFLSLNNGITTLMANITIGKNYFYYIQPYQASVPSQGNALGLNFNHGTAIYAFDYPGNGNIVTVEPRNTVPTTNDNIEIEESQTGIMSNGAALVVNNVHMSNVDRCIRVFNCRGKMLSIVGNRLFHTAQGISLIQNPGTWSGIHNNNITARTELLSFEYGLYNNIYGISVEGGLHNTTNISSNRILEGRTGIKISNANEYTWIQDNLISLPSFSASGIQTGILAENCDGVHIMENTIFGGGGVVGFAPIQTGIELKRTRNYELRCNATAQVGYGITFRADCTTGADKITENQMLNNRYGWRFQRLTYDVGRVGAAIGANNFISKNIFVPPFNNPQGHKTYNYTYSGASYKPIYYYASGQLFYPDLNGSNVSGLAMDADLSTAPTPYFSNECTAGNPGIIDINDDLDYYRSIVDEASADIYYPEFGDIIRNMSQYALYGDLHANNELILGSAIIEAFYQNMSNGDFADVYNYEQSLQLLTDSAVFGDSLAFTEAMVSILNYASHLPDSGVWGNSLEIVSDAYNEFLLYGPDSMNQSTIDSLRNLAHSCPYVRGSAVWEARSLLSIFEDDIFFDDKEICQRYGMYKTDDEEEDDNFVPQKPKFSLNYKAVLFPNPASQNTRIIYSFDKNEQGIASITDVAGRQVARIPLPSNNDAVHLNTSNLSAGTYHCKVSSEKGFATHIKFMVVK